MCNYNFSIFNWVTRTTMIKKFLISFIFFWMMTATYIFEKNTCKIKLDDAHNA